MNHETEEAEADKSPIDIAAEEAYKKLTEKGLQPTDHDSDDEFDFVAAATNRITKASAEDDQIKGVSIASVSQQSIILTQTAESSEEEEANEWSGLKLNERNTCQDVSSTEPLSMNDALLYLNELDLQNYADKIQPCILHDSFCSELFYRIMGPAKLDKSLTEERDRLFAIALVEFENSNAVHVRMLQTIYKKMTNTKQDCLRFGAHWDAIGFQGNDPSTDLRGCGMLGLLITLAFVAQLHTSLLASDVYKLSRDNVQNFPFCLMMITVTRISLQIMRSGKLNKLCNKKLKRQRSSCRRENLVFDVFCELHAAICYRIFTTWRDGHKTMADSGFVLKDVEDFAKAKPMDVIKKYHAGMTSEYERDFVGIADFPEFDKI